MTPRTLVTLPDHVLSRVLQHLPTASLFTASVVCGVFRRLLFSSGPVSQALLKPHLSVLRERFGQTTVPHKLAIPAVRKLLVLYARKYLFGEFSSTVTYDVSELCSKAASWSDACAVPLRRRRFAVFGSLLAYAVKDKRVHIFDTRRMPLRLLATVKLRSRAVAVAVSEVFLVALDQTSLHMYHLLARDTPNFMPVHIYSITVPNLRDPCAVALTPEKNSPPLVAVLGAELMLVHPSHAIAEKRGRFFRQDATQTPARSGEGKGKTSVCSSSSFSGSKSKQQHEWILVSPGTNINVSAPMSFDMSGRHLAVTAQGHAAFLGSAWSNEDSHELARRRINGLKDSPDVFGQQMDADLLFRHYRAPRRWVPKRLDTGDGGAQAEDAMHIWGSYYILTESDTGAVRIVTVAPYENRCMLYRRPESARGGGAHCGYVVWSMITDGKRVGGYVAFSPAEGRLNVLPLERIPWTGGDGGEDVGWELVRECRDIAIGGGEILGMCAGSDRVMIVFENRVVVVRLWVRKVGDVKDEVCEWAVDRKGNVHRDRDGPREMKCFRSKEGCSVM